VADGRSDCNDSVEKAMTSLSSYILYVNRKIPSHLCTSV
jgi:hypothetical protein